MKTNRVIKIFLASSEELEADRYRFGNLIRKLDNIYEKRGIRIELFEWEDYDAAYNGMRKQDEYNERVRASDMFLALFHKKAGKFTIEEFNIARKAFDEQASPKIYTYVKTSKQAKAKVGNWQSSNDSCSKSWGTIGVDTATSTPCSCILSYNCKW